MTLNYTTLNIKTYYGLRQQEGLEKSGLVLVEHGKYWYIYHKATGVCVGSAIYNSLAEAQARVDYLLGIKGIDWTCTFAEFIRSISSEWPPLTPEQDVYLAEFIVYINTLASPSVVVDHVWRVDPFDDAVSPSARPSLRFGAYSWKAYLEKGFPEDSVLHLNDAAQKEWKKSRV